MFELILVPLDTSPESERALELALDLSRKYKSKLLLLSVVDLPDDMPERATQLEAVQARAEQLGSTVKERLEGEGFAIETRIEEGRAAFVICDVAEDLKAGLIVMGSRGLGLTAGGMQQSTSDRVINLAPCPVLVVP